MHLFSKATLYFISLCNKILINMETVVLQSNSKADLKLLTNLAKKIGITVEYLTDEEKEDFGLLNAIKKGRTGEFVNTDNFLKKLKNKQLLLNN